MVAKPENRRVREIFREKAYEGFRRIDRYSLQPQSLKSGEEWAKAFTAELIVGRDQAVVLLYDAALDCVVLNEQFRSAPYFRGDKNPWLLEVSGGFMDKDETPEQTARREAAQETGQAVSHVESIGSFYISPGSMLEKAHFFIASVRVDTDKLKKIWGEHNEGEQVGTHLIPAKKLFKMADAGEIKQLAAYMLIKHLQQNHHRLRTQWAPCAKTKNSRTKQLKI